MEREKERKWAGEGEESEILHEVLFHPLRCSLMEWNFISWKMLFLEWKCNHRGVHSHALQGRGKMVDTCGVVFWGQLVNRETTASQNSVVRCFAVHGIFSQRPTLLGASRPFSSELPTSSWTVTDRQQYFSISSEGCSFVVR